MRLIDQGEGRTVSLYFHVKLTPPVEVPVGEETTACAQIAYELRKAGKAALQKICEPQGYDISISTTHVVY